MKYSWKKSRDIDGGYVVETTTQRGELFTVEIVKKNAAYVFGPNFENCILLSERSTPGVDLLRNVEAMIKDHYEELRLEKKRSNYHRNQARN